MTLLSHYFQPDGDPMVASMAAEDWVDILAPFPQRAISEACRAYMRDEPTRRPTPGAIRGLAAKVLETEFKRAEAARALPPPDRLRLVTPTEQETAEARFQRRIAEERAAAARREAAQRVLDSAGFTARRFQAFQTKRMAMTHADLDRLTAATKPENIPAPEEIAARPYPPGALEAVRARAAKGRYGLIDIPTRDAEPPTEEAQA